MPNINQVRIVPRTGNVGFLPSNAQIDATGGTPNPQYVLKAGDTMTGTLTVQ